MDELESAERFAYELAKFIRGLAKNEIEAIASGASKITLIPSGPARSRTRAMDSVLDVNSVLDQLRTLHDRDAGVALLQDVAPRRSDLTALGRALGLGLQKSDRIDRLRDKIVEASIGFRLRSQAIRNTRTDDEPTGQR